MSDDDRFCDIAIARGLLTSEQVERALVTQSSLSRRQPIGKILVANGWLTPAQVDEVLRAQGEARHQAPALEPGQLVALLPATAFGQLVLKLKLASPGEVDECVALQRELAARGEYVRLGELLVRRSYLARRDVVAVLRLQAKNGGVEPRPRDPTDDARRAADLLVAVREAAAQGKLDLCLAALEQLSDHPDHEQAAERLVRRAFLRVAADRALREKLDVKTCDLCETASAVAPGGGRCSRCAAPLLP